MTTSKPVSAGDEVDSRCTKCKGITNHMVIAMVGDEIAKVQCNNCSSRHKYRPPVAPKTKKVVIGRNTSTTKEKKPRAPRKSRAPEPLPPLDSTNAIPYSMETVFSVKDIVEHNTFGLGLVISTTLPNKIEIHFKEGKKILIGKPNVSFL
ncbi:MAG: hypothetical protein OEM02_06705 [Desulfobulbaceae bacterium]|nr:hypothetical protein [Desulfobulbaceae bacterium]